MNKAPRELRADGEATRARILEVAGEVFALNGYAQGTNKEIAARTGVDQASINYHFGTRSELYQAVLIEAHRRFVTLTDVQQLAESEQPPSQKLWMFIDLLVQRATCRTQGWHMKVLAQEFLSPTSHCQRLFKDEIDPKVTFVRRVLSEIAGIPEDDPAVICCMINIVAPFAILFIGTGGLPGTIQEVLKMPRNTLTRYLHAYALAGLTAIGQECENC